MSCIRLNIIAAVADNDAIGRDNALLWHIREDLQYFKKVTLGCPVIMGRRTFMSLGKPLPGRLNIVVTRSGEIRSSDKAASVRKGSDGIQVAWSIEDAVRIAERSLSYEEFRKAEEVSRISDGAFDIRFIKLQELRRFGQREFTFTQRIQKYLQLRFTGRREKSFYISVYMYLLVLRQRDLYSLFRH